MMDWSLLKKKLKELKEKKEIILVQYDMGHGSCYVSTKIKRVSDIGFTPESHFFIPFANLISVTCSSSRNVKIYVRKEKIPE